MPGLITRGHNHFKNSIPKISKNYMSAKQCNATSDEWIRLFEGQKLLVNNWKVGFGWHVQAPHILSSAGSSAPICPNISQTPFDSDISPCIKNPTAHNAVAIISACIAAAAIQPYCPTADELRNITALPGETRSAHQMDCRNFEPAVVIDDFFHLNFLFTQNMQCIGTHFFFTVWICASSPAAHTTSSLIRTWSLQLKGCLRPTGGKWATSHHVRPLIKYATTVPIPWDACVCRSWRKK